MLIAYFFQTSPQNLGMKLGDFANVAQIVEAIVVTVSVLVILYQALQQTKLAKANNSNTLFQLHAPFYTELIKDRTMGELVAEGHMKYKEFDYVNQVRYRASLAWRITLQANIYYQYHNGLLDKHIFNGWETDFKVFIKKRNLKLTWPDVQELYHKDFHPYVEKIMAEVEAGMEKPEVSGDKEPIEPTSKKSV